MRRPNWIYCVIDRLPDRLPMCHRSKNYSCHRRFMALSMHVAMVMYLQCYHAHQSTPCWRRIDQDLPSGILSVIIWLQRQTVCDTWGWGVGGGTFQEVMLPTSSSASHPGGAWCVLSCCIPRCCCTIISGQRWYAGAGTAHGPPSGVNSYSSHQSCCWEAVVVVEQNITEYPQINTRTNLDLLAFSDWQTLFSVFVA